MNMASYYEAPSEWQWNQLRKKQMEAQYDDSEGES